ncbi:hypothetical protein ZWY2020_028561 [Hordeum vulgare]|nr:hypothetical protein ZWY2020_028561 [Hordeum vulgare]
MLIEIQDTIKEAPPSEAAMTKKAMAFYVMCGCMGYAAFGNDAPDNLLTGFSFYEPFWLVDVANATIVVHLVGAYQALTVAYLTVSMAATMGGVFKVFRPFSGQLCPPYQNSFGVIRYVYSSIELV